MGVIANKNDDLKFKKQQIALFSRLYPMNARPVQASAGRIIKESN